MSAREMFVQCEFYLDLETNNTRIVYSKDINDKDTFAYIDSEIILFDKETRNIYLTNKDYITLKELQAINKQVEELRWNDVKD